MSIGEVHSKDSMFLRISVGSATSGDGTKYDLDTGMNGTPMIMSSKTRKTWSISWNELIELAIAAGIDEESEAADAA